MRSLSGDLLFPLCSVQLAGTLPWVYLATYSSEKRPSAARKPHSHVLAVGVSLLSCQCAASEHTTDDNSQDGVSATWPPSLSDRYCASIERQLFT